MSFSPHSLYGPDGGTNSAGNSAGSRGIIGRVFTFILMALGLITGALWLAPVFGVNALGHALSGNLGDIVMPAAIITGALATKRMASSGFSTVLWIPLLVGIVAVAETFCIWLAPIFAVLAKFNPLHLTVAQTAQLASLLLLYGMLGRWLSTPKPYTADTTPRRKKRGKDDNDDPYGAGAYPPISSFGGLGSLGDSTSTHSTSHDTGGHH